jgi:hypothetical protein
MEKSGQVLFGFDAAESAVGRMASNGWRSGDGRGQVTGFGSKGYVPQTIGVVALADDDDFAIFVYFDVVFCKEDNAFVVAELADGDQRAGFEVFEDVADFGLVGKLLGKRDDYACVGFDEVSVGDFDRGAGCSVADVNAVLRGICIEIVSGGARVYNGGVVGLSGCRWDYGSWI